MQHARIFSHPLSQNTDNTGKLEDWGTWEKLEGGWGVWGERANITHVTPTWKMKNEQNATTKKPSEKHLNKNLFPTKQENKKTK